MENENEDGVATSDSEPLIEWGDVFVLFVVNSLVIGILWLSIILRSDLFYPTLFSLPVVMGVIYLSLLDKLVLSTTLINSLYIAAVSLIHVTFLQGYHSQIYTDSTSLQIILVTISPIITSFSIVLLLSGPIMMFDFEKWRKIISLTLITAGIVFEITFLIAFVGAIVPY